MPLREFSWPPDAVPIGSHVPRCAAEMQPLAFLLHTAAQQAHLTLRPPLLHSELVHWLYVPSATFWGAVHAITLPPPALHATRDRSWTDGEATRLVTLRLSRLGLPGEPLCTGSCSCPVVPRFCDFSLAETAWRTRWRPVLRRGRRDLRRLFYIKCFFLFKP